ncbi:MAG TPA: efflux RND transporter periplasmic adaptor subunit [Macellibacteroides fermentans]|nr:efflux RND transporter periplasmic adaptor subunit [Macellibacteroides fermentans]
MKRFALLGGGILFSILLLGCNNTDRNLNKEAAIPVKMIKIKSAESVIQQSYVGTIEESQASSLSFSVAGNVEKVLVSEGQMVSKGQLLATLDQRVLLNSYQAANAARVQAQDAFDRLHSLYEKGSLPEIKYVEIESKLEQAQAMEQIAAKNLKDCNLYAPFTGVIAQRFAETGVNVLPGAPVFKLSKIEEVDVKVSIPENKIAAIQLGQPVRIRVAALNNECFEGKITEKGIQANPLSHAYDVKIRLANPLHKLMPGMVCNVTMQQDGAAVGFELPVKSVQVEHTGKRFVWVSENGIAKRRYVDIESLSANGVLVFGAVSAGDSVVVEGMQKISEGMKIEQR